MATTYLPSWGTFNSSLALPVFVLIFASWFTYVYSSTYSQDGVYNLGGLSIINAWKFFSKRYDFLRGAFKSCKQSLFAFHVLQHRIVAMAGTEARKVFFSEPTLDFSEGYRILMGGAPRVEDIKVDSDRTLDVFLKRLQLLVRRDRAESVLPNLMDDVDKKMRQWGDAGMINPFKEIYDLVFQMTVRMATCRELADDHGAIEALRTHYWNLEKSATPVSLLLPWFPGSAKKTQAASTKELYTMLDGYVEARRAAKVPNMDAINLLIEQGDSNQRIIEVIMGVIFAGVINTGMNVCWLLLFLGTNPKWKALVSAEIEELLKAHTNPLSPEPLHKRLQSVPMSAWEDSLPSIDITLRETLRMTMTGTALRRNVRSDGLEIESENGSAGSKRRFGKSGDFLAYNLADVHLDESIYSEPLKFDPDRFGPGREEDKKVPMGFLGWGVGRHPCAGMRIAKLEMKVILVLLFVGYDHELVDHSGKLPSVLPQPDRNDIQQARPLGEPVFIKFKRREKV